MAQSSEKLILPNPIEKLDVKNDVKNDVENGVKNDVENGVKNDVK